jgi:alpha-2-macroglobulin-like protein
MSVYACSKFLKDGEDDSDDEIGIIRPPVI